MDYAHGYAEVADVVHALIYGPADPDEVPWRPGMNNWTGIAYLRAAGVLTDEQVTPLRQAYDDALMALLDDEEDSV